MRGLQEIDAIQSEVNERITSIQEIAQATKYNGNFLIKKLELSWQLNLKREWPSILSFYNKKGLITHNCLWDKYAQGELPPILK